MKKSLPNKLLLLGCKDKDNDESWSKKRSLANIPCPFRMLLCAGVGNGKSTVVKNILLQAKPLYDRVVVVCCDASTRDYEDLEVSIVMDKLPSIDSFDNNYKNCLIIDDYRPKTSADKAQLDRLFGYCSSHKKTSIMMCVQDLFAIFSPTIQRMVNVFVLWNTHDQNQLKMICNRVNLPMENMKQIFKDLDFGKKDSLMIDMTSDTPCKYRKNIFEPISEKYVPDL